MVVTPVGMKCPDCGTNRGGNLFTVRPERLVLAGIAALIAGVVAGLIGTIAGFFVFFVSVPYGYFAGSVILKASGMKRGQKMEILAGAGMVLGGLAYRIILFHHVFSISFLIVLVISTSCAVSKIRYI